jgi:2-succinyl-5-enolpyruvyl-6-hydroxy-3-cyclohexene-1-carboxylate synthase
VPFYNKVPKHQFAAESDRHIGQYERGDIRKEVADIVENKQMLVLPEIISDVPGNHLMNAFDYLSTQADALEPDLVVQIGGNFVHKSFKSLLRNTSCCVIRIDEEQGLIDTFCHLQYKIQRYQQLPYEYRPSHIGQSRALAI